MENTKKTIDEVSTEDLKKLKDQFESGLQGFTYKQILDELEIRERNNNQLNISTITT